MQIFRNALQTRLLGALLFFCGPVLAVPDLATQMEVEEITVVRDREASNTFYYLPNSLDIGRDDDGGPRLTYTSTAYSGSVVHGDAGIVDFRVSLYARVVRKNHDAAKYQSAVSELKRRFGAQVVLREMPISKVEASLLYARLDGEPVAIGTGFFEPTQVNDDVNSVWQERDVFLLLDTNSAQVLEAALRNGTLGVSLTYSFYAEAWIASEEVGEVTISGSVEDAIVLESLVVDEFFEEQVSPKPSAVIVAAGAIPIEIAPEYRDSRIRRYHLDGTAPPDYASLVIYCFDFQNSAQSTLFEKVVEFEATGVTGGTTKHAAVFSNDAPELYGRTIRFPFAVDLTEPFRWRVHDLLLSGELITSEWHTETSWAETIDVSGSSVFQEEKMDERLEESEQGGSQ